MTRQLLCCALLAPVFVLVGCASAEGVVRMGYDFSRIDKVAVVEVVGDVGGEAARNAIADMFAMELMKKGYLPVERKQVQALLAEQEFQASELTTDAGAVAAGRILNVPAVLIINVPKFGENISMTAKMIDVQDGAWVWTAEGHGTTGRTLATVGGAALGAAAGGAAGYEYFDDHRGLGTVVGATTGGALGGVAGHALTPKQISQAKKIIRKMCRTLPTR